MAAWRWIRTKLSPVPDEDDAAWITAFCSPIVPFALEGGGACNHLMTARSYRGTRYASDWARYCSRRYRSFDPASGTYLGYDGYRHDCR
jgi:hypothetical protein